MPTSSLKKTSVKELKYGHQHSVLFLLSPALSYLFASILRLVLSVWLFPVPTGLPYHPEAQNPSEKDSYYQYVQPSPELTLIGLNWVT